MQDSCATEITSLRRTADETKPLVHHASHSAKAIRREAAASSPSTASPLRLLIRPRFINVHLPWLWSLRLELMLKLHPSLLSNLPAHRWRTRRSHRSSILTTHTTVITVGLTVITTGGQEIGARSPAQAFGIVLVLMNSRWGLRILQNSLMSLLHFH